MKVIENNSIPGITEAVTKLIASSINNCNDKNDDKYDVKTCALRNKQLELNCFPRKSFADVDVDVDVDDEPVIIGMKCIADHRRAGFSFAITTFVHLPDGDDDFTKIDGPMVITVDVTVYHDDDDDISRDLLVKAVSVIQKSTDGASTGSATSDMAESNWKIQKRNVEYNVDMTVSPSASIEKKVLSNDAIEDKVQVFSSTSSSPSTSTRTDIWEYGLIATTESHRDLFIDSTLRATTTAAGRAHAEAFVHPAIIANINPKRVAIISDMPVAYVKEILKYKSVIDVTIVGSNQEAVEAVKTYMPQLNDCSLIENVADSCMDDERLEIISGDDNGNNDVVVSTWMERMVHECKDVDYFNECAEDPIMCETEPAYDVILVDIANPDQADQWLSHEFYGMLNAISTQETMTAFNIGSAPSVEGGNEYEARNEFIEIVEEYRFKDTDDAIMVYDEVRLFLFCFFSLVIITSIVRQKLLQ
jgi:spermidine synthase